jgi:hypothetical protein
MTRKPESLMAPAFVVRVLRAGRRARPTTAQTPA